MDAKAKRRSELDTLIESRKEDIMKAAVSEFIRCGIDNTKLSDIAKKAEVGTATVYRYFDNKTRLVIECATKLWVVEHKKYVPSFSPEKSVNENGFEKVHELLLVIGSLYTHFPDALQLMEEFDNYIVREKVPRELLCDYETGIHGTENVIIDAIEEGKKDGSVKKDINSKLFYATSTHSITSLSQKLLLRGNIITSDSEVSPEEQIKCLIEMELAFIKN